MKTSFSALLLLAACGGGGSSEIALTVENVAMADLDTVRADLAALAGVRAVRPGALDDGRATFQVSFEGTGGELAERLARTARLSRVTGFDAGSVKVAWGGAAASATPAPAPVPFPAPAAAPAPHASQDPAPDAPSAAPAPEPAPPPAPDPAAPAAADAPPPKDPLAYKIHRFAIGTLAIFEGWKIQQIPNEELLLIETHPQGKADDFQILVAMATPDAQELANLFQEGPQLILQIMPTAQRQGPQKECRFGGDEARLEDYQVVSPAGKTYELRVIWIRKKDVAVGVMGIGTAEGFKAYGRAVEIMAQSITLKDSPPDPALVGTWTRNTTYVSGTFSYVGQRSVTFFPNGTFTDATFSSAGGEFDAGTTSAMHKGGNRGRVVRRGDLLTFHYDSGKTWSASYRIVEGKALLLDGERYIRH